LDGLAPAGGLEDVASAGCCASGEAKEGLIDQLLANSKLPAGHYVMY
jgi:hypothetical protein